MSVQLGTNAETMLDQPYGRYGVYHAEEWCEENDWHGFEIVGSGGIDYLPMQGDCNTGHECAHLLDAFNAETAEQMMREATGTDDGSVWYEWNGYLAYDVTNDAARQCAEEIECALSSYPILGDEMDHSDREHEAACEALEDSCVYGSLPDGVDASDVLSALSDKGYCATDVYCGGCGTVREDDVIEVIAEMGYRKCADCGDEWVETRNDDAVCMACAECYASAECECVSVYLDTLRHGGHVATLANLREILRGCEDCYGDVYPYGREAVTA